MWAIKVSTVGRALSIAVFLAMLALLMVGGAGAVTITLDDSSGADYARIQDAVNAANNGDTITVAAASGFYFFFVQAGSYNLTASSAPRFYTNSSIVVTAISGTTVAHLTIE